MSDKRTHYADALIHEMALVVGNATARGATLRQVSGLVYGAAIRLSQDAGIDKAKMHEALDLIYSSHAVGKSLQ